MKTNNKNSISKEISKNAKVYTNKTKRRLKTSVKIIACYTAALLLVFISLYLCSIGKKILQSETPKIDYSLDGKVDYTVHLKENKYYNEEYLKSGMQYIASLIKSVDIKFKYEAHATDKINYKYKYNVTATTLVNSKNDKTKILFEKKDIIRKDKPIETNDVSFQIDDVISIDYDKYNNYILDYKKDYLLNTSFELVVNIHAETIGTSEISQEGFNESKDFVIIIPLSEQIIDISLDSQKYETSGTIKGIENKTIKVKTVYYSSIVTTAISVVLVINALAIAIISNKKKGKYNKVVEKYLKEYDRAIVITDKSELIEEDYEQVIGISSMQEMLDLHDNLELPILYYETSKNEESYFVIIKENILYKFTVSKKILEENSGDD